MNVFGNKLHNITTVIMDIPNDNAAFAASDKCCNIRHKRRNWVYQYEARSKYSAKWPIDPEREDKGLLWRELEATSRRTF